MKMFSSNLCKSLSSFLIELKNTFKNTQFSVKALFSLAPFTALSPSRIPAKVA